MRRRAGAAIVAAIVVVTVAGVVFALRPSEPTYDFDAAHVLEIDIRIAPDAWGEVRFAQRCLFGEFAADDCRTSNFLAPYEWATATVTIDGQTLANVGVRKKGFGTTFMVDRPGLKLKFDAHEPVRRWMGRRRLTLNTTADPIRTCLAYHVLDAAKLPAPRCAFASVRVNGKALGIYPVVESIDRQFITRHFDDDDGALFEGVLNDFRADHRPVFERKNKRGAPGQPAIDRLTKVLAQEREDLFEAVGGIVDLDAFLTFWAAEVVIARWDGYAGHTNNFFLYDDPDTGRLHFIPWGGNRATFDSLRDPILSPADAPESVIAHGVLARRLYQSDTGRARYFERLHELLDEVWVEERWLEHVAAMERTLAGHPGERNSTETIRDFIRIRRETIEREVAAGPPAWPYDLPASTCMVPVGSLHASFRTTWTATTTPSADRTGAGTMEIILDGRPLAIENVTVTSGRIGLFDVGVPIPPNSKHAASVTLRADLPTRRLAVHLVLSPELWSSNRTIGIGAPYTGCDASGPPYAMVCISDTVPCIQPAFLGRGVVELDAAEMREGADVIGRLDANLIAQPWGLFEGHPNIWRDGAPPRSWLEPLRAD